MKKILALLLFTCFSDMVHAQVSFDKLSKKEQTEIQNYMADFSKIPKASGYIAITPDGKIWDKQNYEPPTPYKE